jgi:tripartite-type tricarboxylate transporter receptor subunit TctC
MKALSQLMRIACLCLLAMAGAVAAQAQGDTYPSKPVRIISDSAPGSTPDVVLRLVADRLSQLWGQQVIAVNQPGAGGSIAARVASESAPDGYTLFMPALSTFASLPGAAPNLPVQVPRDFIPIGFVAENPMFISAPPSLGINTLPELIARAKARPGELSVAVTGVGRLTHLTAEFLQMRTGVKLLIVPYTTGGPAQAFADVVSGRVHFFIEGFSGIAGAVQSGAIKPIAVAHPQRLPEFPDVPTVSETTPDFTATGWQILVAPLGTPEAIVRKVSEDLRKVVTDPDLKKKIATRGSYTRAMTPEEAVAFVQAEQRKWLPVVQHIATKPR